MPATVVHPPRERRIPVAGSSSGPRAGFNRLSPLTQALDLKTQAYTDALAKKTPVHIRAALMRAWVDLQEMAMTLRGQGKPKPVEARNATPKRKRSETAPIVYPGPSDVASKPAPALGETR